MRTIKSCLGSRRWRQTKVVRWLFETFWPPHAIFPPWFCIKNIALAVITLNCHSRFREMSKYPENIQDIYEHTLLTLSTLEAVTVFDFALFSITFNDSLISTRKYMLNTNTTTAALIINQRLCLFVKIIFTFLGQQIVNIFLDTSRQFHFTSFGE